jgi:muramidase (phage lysozyme)
MIAMLPFIKVGLIVGGLYLVFKALYDHGWTLGDVFEALGDNLKRFGISYVDIWLSIAEKIASVFGKGDAIKAARQKLQLEKEELDQKETDRTNRRKTTAQERKLSDDSNSAKQKEIDLTKESTKATEAKISSSKNYDNTIDLLRGTKAGGGSATPSSAGPVSSSSDMQKYLQATALIESGGNANAKAGTSSAGGMFQFIDSTWTQMTKEMGKNYSLQDKFDPKKSAEVMEYFTQKQKAQLEKGTGRAASNTDLYMAHFLGAGGATKFLNAKSQDPNQSAAMLDPKAAAANKSIYYDKAGKERSVQEVYDLMGKKMGGAEQALASGKWGGKAIPAEVAALQGQIGSQGTQVAAASSTQPSSQNVAVAPAQTQETPSSLLASLNTKMDQLIKINRDQHSTSERQLTAQRSQSNNLYVAA